MVSYAQTISGHCMCFVSEIKHVKEQDSGVLTHNQFVQLLFDFCYDCYEESMASIPQGAFASKKMREREMLISKVQNCEQDRPPIYNTNKQNMELSPLKYNSKLMNSIWGLYNRYSVHNFKKNTDAEAHFIQMGEQQRSAVSSPSVSADTVNSRTLFDAAVETVWPAFWQSG